MRFIKVPFYKLVKYLLNSNYFRECIWYSSKDIFCQNISERIHQLSLLDVPEMYQCDSKKNTSSDDQITPIFITARFRSGSTFLWQLFRNIEGITSYYEPLNENRWFLRTLDKPNIDPTHIGIKDYDKEYTGMEDLNKWFRDDWSYRYLYMDEKHYDADLYYYISELIKRTSNRAVLQFNRVDFRLSWLRANFPNAIIVHLYRNPRDQWMSIQRDGGHVPLDIKLSDSTVIQLFYTLNWARDLRHIFTFLEPEKAGHPYAIHYYIWRLSFSFGKCYSDYSIAYESLVSDFNKTFGQLLTYLSINGVDLSRLSKLRCAPVNNSWKEYAPTSWFETIETECDRVLKTYFSNVKVSLK